MDLPPIIAFCGKAGAGKTTICKMIEDQYDCDIISFADPLRHLFVITMDRLGYSDDYIANALEKKDNPSLESTSLRQFNRDLGDLLRSYDPQIFCDMLGITAVKLTSLQSPCILIDDCRYLNEAKFLKGIGATIIRIDREEGLRDVKPHSSEEGIPDSLIDLTIENYSSMDNLEVQAESIARQFDFIRRSTLELIEECSSVN